MDGDAGEHPPAGPPVASSRRPGRIDADPHRTTAVVVSLAFAAVYAGWASDARPFSALAYICVSIPSAFFIAAVVLERRWPRQGPWKRLPADRPASHGGAALWLAVIALLVAVELASYLHSGPRADYPTISSGLNALFAHQATKAAGFLAWLAIGWFLARR